MCNKKLNSIRLGCRLIPIVVVSLLPMSLNAAILFNIDVSNPSAVTISATGNFVQASDSSSSYYPDGIVFANFLQAPYVSSSGFYATYSGTYRSITSSDLTIAGNTTSAYQWDMFGVPFVNRLSRDLQITGYQSDPVVGLMADQSIQNFTSGITSFTGTLIADFSYLGSLVPAVGQTGNIVTGDYNYYSGQSPNNHSVILGTYIVSSIPEPSTYTAILGAIAIGVAGYRRQARRK